MKEIKIEDVLSFVGIEKGEDEELTLDSLKAKFSEKFIARDKVIEDKGLVNSIFGQKIGSVDTKIRAFGKESGVEFGDDQKEMKIEDLMDFTFKSIKTNHSSQLEEAKKDQPEESEAVKQWSQKYAELEGKHNDTSRLLEEAVNKHDAFVEQTTKEKKEFKIKTVVGSAINKVKFKQGITDVERAGFNAVLNDKYSFEVDNDGNAFVKSKETGEKISNPDKMGEFLGVDDVISKEASTQKLTAINDMAGVEGKKKKLGSSKEDVENGKPSNAGRNPRVLSTAAQT